MSKEKYLVPETVWSAVAAELMLCDSADGSLEDFTDGGTYTW